MKTMIAATLAASALLAGCAAPGYQPYGYYGNAQPQYQNAGYTQYPSQPQYTTAQYGAPSGTLPRLMTRAQALEADLPDRQRSGEPPSEKDKAFHLAALGGVPLGAASHAIAIAAALPLSATAAASFKARAPPSPSA